MTKSSMQAGAGSLPSGWYGLLSAPSKKNARKRVRGRLARTSPDRLGTSLDSISVPGRPQPNRMRMTGDVGMVATSTTQSIDYSLAIGQNKPAGWSAGEPKRCLLIGGVHTCTRRFSAANGLVGSLSCLAPYPTVTKFPASIPYFSESNCFTASARRSDRP